MLDSLPDPAKPLTFSVTLLKSTDGCWKNCHDFIISQGKLSPSDPVYVHPTDEKIGTPIDRKLTLTGGPVTIITTQPASPLQTKKWTYGDDQHGTQPADYSLLRLILDKDNVVEQLPDGWKVTLKGNVPVNGLQVAGTVTIQLTLHDQKLPAFPSRDAWPVPVVDPDNQGKTNPEH